MPADYGLAVWEAISCRGQPHGITPYGTEAMHVLRAEKGYIIVGQETDGTVTPDDAGLGWAIGKTKPDFVGKRSLARETMHAPDRKQLVGLLTADPQGGAGGGRADRRHARPARADEADRPRHLLVPQRRARPLDRAGAGARRPRAHRRDAVRADARRRDRREGDRRRCSTTPRERASMADVSDPPHRRLAGGRRGSSAASPLALRLPWRRRGTRGRGAGLRHRFARRRPVAPPPTATRPRSGSARTSTCCWRRTARRAAIERRSVEDASQGRRTRWST